MGVKAIAIPAYAAPIVEMKIRAVAQAETAEGGWLPPIVIAMRGGRVACLAVAPKVDKRLGLKAAHQLRVGFDPDELVMFSDGFYGSRKKEDAPWPEGMLQQMAAEGATPENDGVGEALLFVGARASGEATMLQLKFARRGREIEWSEPAALRDDEGGGRVGGFVVENLRDIMKVRPLVEHPALRKAGDRIGMSRAQRLRHSGNAAVRALEERGFEIIRPEG